MTGVPSAAGENNDRRGVPAVELLPGVALAISVALAALAVHTRFQLLPPFVVSVALGVALANSRGVPTWARTGLAFAAVVLLRIGVVLLGFDLAFPDVVALGGKVLALVVAVVAITFVGTRWAGRRLGLSAGLSTLVAVGFSICGVSAIAAARDLVDADEDEVAFAIALVTLFGTIAIVLLPLLRHPLGLDQHSYGAWVGASVHDVGQVVAAASVAGSGALAVAVVVKLTRVILLAPMIALLAAERVAKSTARAVPTPIPWFVVGFIAAIGLASTRILDASVVLRIDDLRTVLFGAALFAIGSRVSIVRLRHIGPRPLLLGLVSWILVASMALVGIHLAAL